MREKEKTGAPEVFVYNTIPQALRNQIIHLWGEGFEHLDSWHYDHQYAHIHDVLAKEHGLLRLSEHSASAYMDVQAYFLGDRDISILLDIIELVFREITALGKQKKSVLPIFDVEEESDVALMQTIDNLIEELNARFKQHSVGYQWINDHIIRVDNSFLHQEAVKPCLFLVKELGFAGVEDELYKAYDAYKSHPCSQTVLQEASKAFESTMITILTRLNYPISAHKKNASHLIEYCKEAALFKPDHQDRMNALYSLLTNGPSSVRNKYAAHGQGVEERIVDEHLVAYALHMTTATILFLCHSYIKKIGEQQKDLPPIKIKSPKY
tara:strand:+ start:32673 stop:33644 length:972 start_codon:yes stop_codon:yes gene_type:complete